MATEDEDRDDAVFQIVERCETITAPLTDNDYESLKELYHIMTEEECEGIGHGEVIGHLESIFGDDDRVQLKEAFDKVCAPYRYNITTDDVDDECGENDLMDD